MSGLAGKLRALFQRKPELRAQIATLLQEEEAPAQTPEATPPAPVQPSQQPEETKPAPVKEKPYTDAELIRDIKVKVPDLLRQLEGVLYRGVQFEEYEVYKDSNYGKGTIFRFLVDRDSDEPYPPRILQIYYPEEGGRTFTVQGGYVNSASHTFMVEIRQGVTIEELANPVTLFAWITRMDRHFLKAHIAPSDLRAPSQNTPQGAGDGNVNVNNNDVKVDLTVNVSPEGEVKVKQASSSSKLRKRLIQLAWEHPEIRDPELLRILKEG